LRRHLDKIFAADPQVNLLCYGDFNDSKNEPAFQEIAGPKGGPGALTELICRDREGDRWTHYWRANDQYTRIDYLLVSAGLSWEIAKEKCGIFRSANGVDWSEASDHRPVFMSVRPLERRR
jgi:endonuclease/exonuclease/phosphatase family metal-dependent hydrolase